LFHLSNAVSFPLPPSFIMRAAPQQQSSSTMTATTMPAISPVVAALFMDRASPPLFCSFSCSFSCCVVVGSGVGAGVG